MQDRPKFRHVDDIVAEKESKEVEKQENMAGLEGLDSNEKKAVLGMRNKLNKLRSDYVLKIDTLDLTEKNNKNDLLKLVYRIMIDLTTLDQGDMYNEVNQIFVKAIESVLGRDSSKSEQVNVLKNFEAAIESTIVKVNQRALKEKAEKQREEALEKAEKLKRQKMVEQAEVETGKTGSSVEKVVDTKVEQSESSMGQFMNYIENGLFKNLDDIKVGTDTLNRSQSMRYLYSAEDAQLDNFSGDQILLRTAINKVFEKERFEMGFGVDELMNNLDEITDREVAYIVAAYQQINGLTVDGKFGPNTFKALEKDAGVKIVDRSTNEEAVSRYKKLGEVQSYIDLES
jgi:murein L,D-transpeptidase YcbB/YkuD